MTHSPILAYLVGRMLAAHVLTIRNIKAGEEAFLYSSLNHGPGYLMVKGLVSQRALMKALCYQVAIRVLEVFPEVEYVAGNATGGMIPGWCIAEALSNMTARDIPNIYVRNTRKVGGHGEHITGNRNNDFFATGGRRGLTVEELVNFAETTTNSVLVQRENGFEADFAATILTYDHENARKLLADTGVTLIPLFTLPEFLDYAVGAGYEKGLVDDYLYFLGNPDQWQLNHGYELPKKKEGV